MFLGNSKLPRLFFVGKVKPASFDIFQNLKQMIVFSLRPLTVNSIGPTFDGSGYNNDDFKVLKQCKQFSSCDDNLNSL